MTLLVGILCTDGVVVAADSGVTLGQGNMHTAMHLDRKIALVGNKVIVAGTGQVGMGQRWVDTVQTAWNDRVFGGGRKAIDVHRELCKRARDDFTNTKAQMNSYGALLAYSHRDGFSLAEYAVTDFQPEMLHDGLWFSSMGSGKQLADAYLMLLRDALWKKKIPSLEQGIFGAAFVMKRSIDVAPGNVHEPIDIAVIRRDGDGARAEYSARMLDNDERDLHLEAVQRSVEYFGTFSPTPQAEESAPEIPEPPVPDPPAAD